MNTTKTIQSALISVFDKEGLEPIVRKLHEQNVIFYSTGGTEKHIQSLSVPVTAVEDITGYPSIFGGRVKTLHPKIFGGILFRRNDPNDIREAIQYDIPSIDLIIVDLYPFEETVASGGNEEDIIEKIDIGGISLIRAAAKNHSDVLVVAAKEDYVALEKILHEQQGQSTQEQRRQFAAKAFEIAFKY